ncbi:MAG: type 1 glutamine amidotransferase domain-containing protein [Pseudomonadota bacterium]
MAQPRVLMVLTSNDKFGFHGGETGVWLEEFAAPVYMLAEAGLKIGIATIKGGPPPIDPNSLKDDAMTDATRRFQQDEAMRAVLAEAPKLASVGALDYDAVFLPGGHGTMWDFPTAPELTVMLEQFALREKPIAAVCHGPAALAPVMDRRGRPLVEGKTVSVFTDAEEEAVGLAGVIPFSLEKKMRALGAEIAMAEPFQPRVSVDGNLITGQNPASSVGAAEAMVSMLRDAAVDAA